MLQNDHSNGECEGTTDGDGMLDCAGLECQGMSELVGNQILSVK